MNRGSVLSAITGTTTEAQRRGNQHRVLIFCCQLPRLPVLCIAMCALNNSILQNYMTSPKIESIRWVIPAFSHLPLSSAVASFPSSLSEQHSSASILLCGL